MRNPFSALSEKLKQTTQLRQQVELAGLNQLKWENQREALLGQAPLGDAPISEELLNLQVKIQLGPIQQPILQRQYEAAREELWKECRDRQPDYDALRDDKVDALNRVISKHLQPLFPSEHQLQLATENAYHDHALGRELREMSLSRAFSIPDPERAEEVAQTMLTNQARLREITIPEKL